MKETHEGRTRRKREEEKEEDERGEDGEGGGGYRRDVGEKKQALKRSSRVNVNSERMSPCVHFLCV